MGNAEEPRRSGRVRNAVKTYATEQAELAVKAPAPQRKRKAVTKAKDNDYEPASAPRKKLKQARLSSDAAVPEDDQESADDYESEIEEPVKKKAPKKGRKTAGAIPLDQQVRVPPHSKIYPLPEVKRTAATTWQGGYDYERPEGSAWHGEAAHARMERAKSRVPKLAPGQTEKRLRAYVAEPDDKYRALEEKANTEKMFIIDRERASEEDCHARHDDCPSEVLQIAGSQGNVYTVTISHIPTCDCPTNLFQRNGEQKICKHVVYVLLNVLKVPEHLAHLRYQNALLTSELHEIFDNAPELPIDIAANAEPTDGNRKPLTDDCPICFTDFEGDKKAVYCRTSCGNNIHTVCFKQWEKVKAGNVTCPFCRAPWESEDDEKKKKVNVAKIALPGQISASGYQNVAHLLDYE
ncbi:hypothetical protein LTR56_020783 [Elasticomyces elasticus]|nr:hypothetical protein LTR56_020783 [Elasticomyces elasticus]KAK3659299.1 hypothetical protein LTR22_008566 [Elasticomyces elasticus]KAK4925789.1 hypothetical protein LTR49_007165 [Elasticomyces elasticus]KAK5764741.1 hypothetical protein LTS12_005010 [Elasticomyces elasticus]